MPDGRNSPEVQEAVWPGGFIEDQESTELLLLEPRKGAEAKETGWADWTAALLRYQRWLWVGSLGRDWKVEDALTGQEAMVGKGEQ